MMEQKRWTPTRKALIFGHRAEGVLSAVPGMSEPFHGGNTGSNPVGDASSKPLESTRVRYAQLHPGRLRNNSGGNKAGNKNRLLHLIAAFAVLLVVGGSAEGWGWWGWSVRGAPRGIVATVNCVAVVSDAICPDWRGWCWKQESWCWDEAGNITAYWCESGSDCPGECELTCYEPVPEPDPREDFQQFGQIPKSDLIRPNVCIRFSRAK